MENKTEREQGQIALSHGRNIWVSGVLLSMVLFLANLLVFQNLIQKPVIDTSITHSQIRKVLEFSHIEPISLSQETLEEFKKREHIRTLVYQNFKGIPLKERAVLFDVIYNQSLEMEIDPYLTLSIIATESSFRKKALSWAGAYGLMQVKPIAAEEVSKELGIPWEGDESLYDPVVNITIGLRYLAKMKKRFGSITDALTAYNYGPQYVVSCLRNDRKLPDKYVKKIVRNLTRYGRHASGLIVLDNQA